MPIERVTSTPAPDNQPPLDTLVDLGDSNTIPPEAETDDISVVEDVDGGATVDLSGGGGGVPATKPDMEFYANLAEYMDEDELETIGLELSGLVEADKRTLHDWEEIYTSGIKMLGFNPNDTEGAAFNGACAATHPVLAESIVKYQAKARSQIMPGGGPVRVQVLGKSTPDKEARAQRVKEFLNFQITTLMPEYEPEHDRALFHQAFGGIVFTKTYFDELLRRPCSRMVKPQKFIIDYNATDLESAYRYAEIIELHPNELRKYQLAKFYRDVDTIVDAENDAIRDEADKLDGRSKPDTQEDAYTLYEVHTFLGLDNPLVDDRTPEEFSVGLELPYIVTIDKGSNKVLSIRRNWRENDARREKRVWYTAWPFIPGFGFFGYGYVHLIGGLAKTATVSLRQLVDAGSFANLPAGFKTTGLRVVGDNAPLKPGEWRDAQVPGQDLQKAFLPLPYKEPSPTLYKLLEFMVATAQKFADSTEQVVSESSNYGPVGTTMALLEASGRLFSGIHERLFKSQKAELGLLAEINKESLPEEYPYDVVGGDRKVFKKDFDGSIDIIPVTDPSVPTAAHRVAKANATLAIAQQFPAQHNLRAVLTDLHASLGAEDPQKYMNPPPQVAKPLDPLSENQLILTNMPVVSAPYQDHDSHIAVHLAIVNNQAYSQNPTVVQATMAHVQEHLAQKMRVDIERNLGKPIQVPNSQQPLSPEQENALAAQAAAGIKALKDEQAQDSMKNDPAIMLQLAEVKLRDAQNKLKKYEIDKKDKQHYEELTTQLKIAFEEIKKDLAIADKSAKARKQYSAD